MALLKYDIAIVGAKDIDRALSGIERRFVQHDQRVMRHRGAGQPRGRSQKPSDVARGFDQIGRAARAAELKTSRDAIRNIATEERQKKASLLRLEKEARRIENRKAREQERANRKAENAAKRANAAAARESVRSRRAFARGTLGTLRGAVDTLGGIGRAGVGLVGVAGSLAAGNAISVETSERLQAAKLANQGQRPELKGTLLNEARSIRGFSGSEALGAMGAFTDLTGDLDTARKILPELGQLALATGTDFAELAAVAGNVFIPLSDQIKDPTERLMKLKGVMRAVAGMGTVGAVEIKDLAKEFAGLAAASNAFAGNPDEIMNTVTAMAQAARQRGGAESAAEAVTSVTRFVDDVIAKKKNFQGMGINVFADKEHTKLLDPEEIMVQMLQKTGGSLDKMGKLFGVRAARAARGFAPLYTNAGGGKAGEDAVRSEFTRLKAASVNDQQVKERAASVLAEPAMQFKESMKALNSAMGRELLPVVSKLVGKLTEMIPTIARVAQRFAELVDWFSRNPFSGVGLIIGAAFLKEITAAGIPKLIERAVMGGGSGGGSFTGGGKTDVLGALSAGFTVGTIVAGTITATGIKIFEDIQKGQRENAKNVARAAMQSPEELAKNIAGQKGELEKRRQADERTSNMADLATGGLPWWANVLRGNLPGAAVAGFESVMAPERKGDIALREQQLDVTETTGGTKRQGETVEAWASALSGGTDALKRFNSELSATRLNRSDAPSPVK